MSAAEFVIATGLTAVLAGLIATEYAYFTRSFSALQHYMYLSGKSRYAMDRMSRDIRQADSITAFATNQLTISLAGTNVTFNYNATDRTLSRQSAGTTEVFLTGCDYLRFDVFDRSTVSNSFSFTVATNVTSAKVVQMDWVCSKKIFGKKGATENIQSAVVTLRKQ